MAETKTEFSDTITDSLNKMYNLAIDHAIELVKQHHVPFTERDLLLISKLQALKK